MIEGGSSFSQGGSLQDTTINHTDGDLEITFGEDDSICFSDKKDLVSRVKDVAKVLKFHGLKAEERRLAINKVNKHLEGRSNSFLSKILKLFGIYRSSEEKVLTKLNHIICKVKDRKEILQKRLQKEEVYLKKLIRKANKNCKTTFTFDALTNGDRHKRTELCVNESGSPHLKTLDARLKIYLDIRDELDSIQKHGDL